MRSGPAGCLRGAALRHRDGAVRLGPRLRDAPRELGSLAFRDEVTSPAAPIHGKPKDDLTGDVLRTVAPIEKALLRGPARPGWEASRLVSDFAGRGSDAATSIAISSSVSCSDGACHA
jgi:hypothetical protein